MCMHACSVTQLCLVLYDPMDYSPLGSSVHGIFQVGILQWIGISSCMGPSWPRDQTHVSCVSYIGRWILYHCAIWEAHTLAHKYTPAHTHTHTLNMECCPQRDLWAWTCTCGHQLPFFLCSNYPDLSKPSSIISFPLQSQPRPFSPQASNCTFLDSFKNLLMLRSYCLYYCCFTYIWLSSPWV